MLKAQIITHSGLFEVEHVSVSVIFPAYMHFSSPIMEPKPKSDQASISHTCPLPSKLLVNPSTMGSIQLISCSFPLDSDVLSLEG